MFNDKSPTCILIIIKYLHSEIKCVVQKMSRSKKNKKNRDTQEYLINTVELCTWENELTLSQTYQEAATSYLQTANVTVAVCEVDQGPQDFNIVTSEQPCRASSEAAVDVNGFPFLRLICSSEDQNLKDVPHHLGNVGENIVPSSVLSLESSAPNLVLHSMSREQLHVNENHSIKSACSANNEIGENSLSNRVCQHQLMKRTDVRYVCQLCGFKCYKYPERAHSNSTEKPLKCVECDKGFSKPSYLKKHQNTHNKPFKCDQCGKVFSANNSLRLHQRTHTKHINNSYKRDECGKFFSSKLHFAEE